MARPRVNALARVGAVAFAGAATPVVPVRRLPPRPSAGVVRCDAAGLPQRIVWSLEDGTVVHDRPVGFLATVPGMALALASAIAATWTTASRADTVGSAVSKIRDGLAGYLAAKAPSVAPAAMRAELLDGFEPWLRARFAEGTSIGVFAVATQVLRAIPGVTCRIPRNPFRREGVSDPIDAGVLEKVLAAASAEALAVMAWFDALGDRSHPLWVDAVEGPRLAVVAGLKRLFGEVPPRRVQVASRCPELLAGYDALKPEFVRLWGPAVENVGCFAVLLAWFFRLNVANVRTLRWSEFDRVGGEMLVSKVKKRGGVRQIPGFPVGGEPVNPEALRSFLRRWTDAPRACAGTADGGFVLTVWRGGSVGRAAGGMSRPSLLEAVVAFRARRGTPSFSLDQLRPTTVERVARVGRGDPERARATGRHGLRTSRRHYRSEVTRLDDRKRFALAQLLRRRDLGQAAVAGSPGRPGGGGRMAATPGWTCADPSYRAFASGPDDLPCDAVGMCPVCIKGSTDLGCVRAFALSLALLEAVSHELDADPHPARTGVLEPVRDALTVRWLPAFDDAVRGVDDAALPHVPSLRGALSWPNV